MSDDDRSVVRRDLFPAATTQDIRLKDKIDELERELAMRHRVYPMLIAKGKLSREQSHRRILILRAILEDYKSRT